MLGSISAHSLIRHKFVAQQSLPKALRRLDFVPTVCELSIQENWITVLRQIGCPFRVLFYGNIFLDVLDVSLRNLKTFHISEHINFCLKILKIGNENFLFPLFFSCSEVVL